jgi:hypothetical protein
MRRSRALAGAPLWTALAVLFAVLALAAGGFEREVLFDVGAGSYGASVGLFADGTRDVEIDAWEPGADIPYILPGPADDWAGRTTHALRFRLGALSRPAVLRLDAVETHDVAPPHLTVRLNEAVVGTLQTRQGTGTPPPHDTRGTRSRYQVRIPPVTAGSSAATLSVTNDQGSWVMWEGVRLEDTGASFAWSHLGAAGVRAPLVGGALVVSLAALLIGSLTASRGLGKRARLGAAGSALALAALVLTYGAPPGFPLASLPRWLWLAAPWLGLAASGGVFEGAARAVFGRTCRVWSPWHVARVLGPGIEPRRRGPSLAVAGACFLLAFFVQALLVKAFAVDLPFWDEWNDHGPLFAAYRAGTLTWLDLFAQHNEHRMLFPRLLFLGVFAFLGEWSPRANMLVSASLAGGIAFVWAYTLQRLGAATWLAWISSIILVSPLQWENMLWGYQVSIYLSVLCSVVAVSVVALDRGMSWSALVAAMAACSVASFSFAIGLASWVAIGLCLASKVLLGAPPSPMRRFGWLAWSQAAVFVLAGGLNAAAFFHRLEPARVAPLQLGAGAARWIVIALGYPFVEGGLDRSLVPIVGAALLQWTPIVGIGLFWVFRRDDGRNLGGLLVLAGMASFVAVNAVVISVGRSSIPYIASRYASIFLWSSLLALLGVAALLREARKLPSRARLTAGVALGLVGVALLSPHAVRYAETRDRIRESADGRRRAMQSVLKYLDDRSPARRLDDPPAYPVKPYLEALLRDPAQLALMSLEIRLPRSPTWRVEATGNPGDSDRRRWHAGLRAESPAILVQRPVVVVPVSGYPNEPGNWLAIEAVGDPRQRIFYGGPGLGDSRGVWWVDASAFVGQRIRVVGVAGQGGGPGWIEFGRPGQTGRLLGILSGFPSGLAVFVGAVAIGLLSLWPRLAAARGRQPSGPGHPHPAPLPGRERERSEGVACDPGSAGGLAERISRP